MCGVPEAKIGHSQLCFVIIHNVIIIIIIMEMEVGSQLAERPCAPLLAH